MIRQPAVMAREVIRNIVRTDDSAESGLNLPGGFFRIVIVFQRETLIFPQRQQPQRTVGTQIMSRIFDRDFHADEFPESHADLRENDTEGECFHELFFEILPFRQRQQRLTDLFSDIDGGIIFFFPGECPGGALSLLRIKRFIEDFCRLVISGVVFSHGPVILPEIKFFQPADRSGNGRNRAYEQKQQEENSEKGFDFFHGVSSEIEIDERIVGAFDDIRNGEHENEQDEQENSGIQDSAQDLYREPFEKVRTEKPVTEQKFETGETENERSQQVGKIFRYVEQITWRKPSGTGQAEHCFEVKPGPRDIGGPEQHPSEDDHRHGVDISQWRTFLVDPDDPFRQEQDEIEQPPAQESPVGAVPESGKEPDDQQVEDHSRERIHAAAAERDVNIIPEPGGQRDMPPAPEIGDAAGNVREIEVLHKMESEHFSQSDRHVGIS